MIDLLMGSCDSTSTVSSSWKLFNVFKGPSVMTGPCGLERLCVSRFENEFRLIAVPGGDWQGPEGLRIDALDRDGGVLMKSVRLSMKRFSNSASLGSRSVL